jgi:hypothetical protein
MVNVPSFLFYVIFIAKGGNSKKTAFFLVRFTPGMYEERHCPKTSLAMSLSYIPLRPLRIFLPTWQVDGRQVGDRGFLWMIAVIL